MATSPPPPPPPPGAPPKSRASARYYDFEADDDVFESLDRDVLESYDDDDTYGSGSVSDSYYSGGTDCDDFDDDLDDLEDDEAADTSSVIGELVFEALQLIGVAPPESPGRGGSSSRRRSRRSSGRESRSDRRRHRRHRRVAGGSSSSGRRLGDSERSRRQRHKSSQSKSRRDPVADTPPRPASPAPRSAPGASIMTTKSQDKYLASALASTSSGVAPPPPPPPPPTEAEWAAAIRADRELQVVQILVTNERAREAYVGQLRQKNNKQNNNMKQENNNQKQKKEREEQEEKPEPKEQEEEPEEQSDTRKDNDNDDNKNTSSPSKEADSSDNDMGKDQDKDDDDNSVSSIASLLRLSLHEEILADRIRYDPAGGLLYYVESTAAHQYFADDNNAADHSGGLRIVPRSLRRKLFRVAVHQMQNQNQQDKQYMYNLPSPSSAANSNDAAAAAATFSSVYRHLRSSYYWADMSDDVRRWHEDWERMRLSNARVLGVLAAASGAIGPTTPNRVTFRDGANKAGDGMNTTLDTCLEMTPTSSVPSTPITNNKSPMANSSKKTASPMKGLRRAMKSLSPKRAAASSSPFSSPQRKGLATVGYSQRGSSRAAPPPSDGSVVSAPPIPRAPRPTSSTGSVPRGTAATPPPLPDAPAIVRRTSFGTLLRSKSRDVDDDAATVESYTNTPTRQSGTKQATPTSSQHMRKSGSVESFGKRVKGIGKKIGAAGRKTVGSKKSRSSSPSPSCVSADAKSRASLAWHQQEQEKEKSGAASLADSMQLASTQLFTFLNTLADTLCNDCNSGDEAEVWQRAVPTVIGSNKRK